MKTWRYRAGAALVILSMSIGLGYLPASRAMAAGAHAPAVRGMTDRLTSQGQSLPVALAHRMLVLQRAAAPRTTWNQQAELSPCTSCFFGSAVALSGTVAVIGAPKSNTVYIFARTGSTWSQQAAITATDSVAGDFFGSAVAFSGNTIMVGAPYKNHLMGAAYVFVHSGTSWSQQAEFRITGGPTDNKFGYAVSISGNLLIVGAPGNTNATPGAAYVYVRSGTTWSRQAELTASDGATGDSFGISVAVGGALSSATAVIGASGKNGNSGAAYTFVRSGTTWSQKTELTASDGATNSYFGIATAFNGSIAVIGASGRNAAYIFVRSGSGSTASWSQQAELAAPSGATVFGHSVGISGDIAIVGAIGTNNSAGTAYVYAYNGAAWSQQAELTASDSEPGSYFGYAVAISGSTVLIGAQLEDTAYVCMGS